jgi:hypothetical protein
VSGLLPSILAEILREFGVLAEGPVISHGTFEDHARLCHGRGDDFRIGALFCRTLMEKIAVGAPHASNAAFIEGAAIACPKKPRDVW